MKIFPHPEVVFQTSSVLSGDIKVVGHGPERRLLVGGLTQSANSDLPGVQEKVWGQLLNFPFEVNKNPEILVLGLGGATVVHLASKKYNPKSIEVVEIDRAIIDVAQNYFNLAEIPNLSVVRDDAVDYLKARKERRFDLVVVDIYLGPEFPSGANGEDFYGDIKDVLRPGGAVSINRIFYDYEIESREEYRRTLLHIFALAEEKVLPAVTPMKNYLYFAQS